MKCLLAPLGLVMMLCASAIDAGECRGVQFPDQMSVQGTSLALNGLGVRKATILKISVYVAALYVVDRSNDPRSVIESKGPVALTLHFVRNVDAQELRERWQEAFAKSSPEQVRALQDRVAQLNGWMTDVRSGDRLSFIRIPERGMQVVVKGQLKGMIAGDDFAKAMLAIWLGEQPPNPELKSGLLGGSCG